MLCESDGLHQLLLENQVLTLLSPLCTLITYHIHAHLTKFLDAPPLLPHPSPFHCKSWDACACCFASSSSPPLWHLLVHWRAAYSRLTGEGGGVGSVTSFLASASSGYRLSTWVNSWSADTHSSADGAPGNSVELPLRQGTQMVGGAAGKVPTGHVRQYAAPGVEDTCPGAQG